jgi:hypothetical protein
VVIDPNVINARTLTNLTISGSAISDGFLVVFVAKNGRVRRSRKDRQP